MTQRVPERAEIAREQTWDAESIFASEAAWAETLANTALRIADLEAFRGRLSSDPTTLADYLTLAEELLRNAGRVGVYARMFYAVNTQDQAARARVERATALTVRLSAANAFGEPELLAIGAETLARWTAEEPRLSSYAHHFTRLARRAAHVRSSEVEELLSQVSEPLESAAATHGIIANADLRFALAHDSNGTEHEIAQGTINALITHPDPLLRRTAWEHYADAHLALKNSIANCLATEVKKNVFLARARRYNSALDSALKPKFIPIEVYHNLISSFQQHLPIWHRYWKLRQRLLGRPLHVYDSKAPLTGSPLKVPYSQAIEWICAGMAPLGSEYVSVMRRGLTQQRWVDVYPSRGKRAGAFSMGVPGTYPFIMMSYNNDIFGLSTLAHELGHSMHSFYTCANQPYVYTNYGLFLAEVASNFNQALVRAHLLEELRSRDEQISVLEEAMANFHRYFFIMPTLARFELAIHQQVEDGGALTADSMIALMADLFAEGYGDSVVVDRERVGSVWMQFATHLYANFYVYQYATGIAAAHALASDVLAGKPGATERYLHFLKAGSSRYPLETLQLAGVGMSSTAPIEAGFVVLDSYVSRLEQLLAEP